MIPARTVTAEPMTRLASHQRSCLYCHSTPPDQPSTCGQRIWIEEDAGVVRSGWKRGERAA